MAEKASHADSQSSGPQFNDASGGSEDAQHSEASPSSTAPGHETGTSRETSKLRRLWTKLRPDTLTLILMFKGSLPPTIAIALFQADSFAQHYSTLGYLVAIASVLGFCIMPRGKFLQTMAVNVCAVCVAAAVNLLALYCSIQARLHTAPADAAVDSYNASASAVCAIWLIVFVYAISVVRATRPQMMFPAILFTIFSVVSMSYGVVFPDMTYAISFMKRLLEAFLTGFALATAVSLLVFPISSRKVVMKEIAGYINLLNALLKLQTAFMASLEDIEDHQWKLNHGDDTGTQKKGSKSVFAGRTAMTSTPISLKLRETLASMFALHSKLSADITPAKREFAIGKLESHDFTELWNRLRMVFVPVMGLTTLVNILDSRAEIHELGKEDAFANEESIEEQQQAVHSLKLIMKQLHEPFLSMSATLDGAFKHVLITLELAKPPKKASDEESTGGEPAPGTAGFAEAFKNKVDRYFATKEQTLREWFRERGIELPPNFFSKDFSPPEDWAMPRGKERERRQRQLFFLLYLEHLLWRVSLAVLELIMYLEKRKQEGAFRRSRLIFPGSKTLYKWARSVFSEADAGQGRSIAAELEFGDAPSLTLGQEFLRQKDPEHLPPKNGMERMGEAIRAIPRFFRSDASAFALRVAAAVMSVAIINYLHASQDWFIEQRLLWAEIMVAISMGRLAGQSIFTFTMRVLGTAVAMAGCYVVWYIVDGKTAGVIVFLWLWIGAGFYVVLKFPKFLIVGILGLVTAILIIGYELQTRKLGLAIAEANHQPAYPVYVLAPYRLATVVGGLFVAFIWTIFPFPISESTEVRKDLATTLYLLSNYYSVVHETVSARVKGVAGQEKIKGTHDYFLHKARMSLFSRLILLLSMLQQNADFSKFQLTVGGRFPREEYEEIIASCRRLFQWVSLISFASQTFERPPGQEATPWQRDFRTLIASTQVASHELTSLLALLSSSLAHGQPLPPYVQPPPPFLMSQQLDQIDADILSVRHVTEPEYSAFAVMQAATQYIRADVAKVKRHVTTLVGEIDFSYHGIRTSADASSDDTVDQTKDKQA